MSEGASVLVKPVQSKTWSTAAAGFGIAAAIACKRAQMNQPQNRDTDKALWLGGAAGALLAVYALTKVKPAYGGIAALTWLGSEVLLEFYKRKSPKSDHVAGYDSFFTGAGTSFEEAWSHAAQSYTPGGTHVTDLTAEQLAQPFAGAAFLNTCGVPGDMSVLIKAAVQNGHAIGVTVTTTPPSARHVGCIDAAVRRMQFPANPNLDAVTQTF